MSLKSLLLVSLASMASGVMPVHAADDYPTQPIRLVVPYPPGGPVDFVARSISVPLGQELGQSIIIDNKGGAGGNIAAGEVSRAKPDGYTLSLVYETHATANLFSKNYKFDSFQSFEYISLLGHSPMVLVTSIQSGLDTFPKFIAALKASPGRFNQATTGPGAASILKPELMHQALGTKVTYVPFSGAGPAFTALAGGQIDVALASVTAMLPLIQAKKVNAVAVGSSTPLALLPGVPAAGSVIPGYESTAWIGLVAPKGTPVTVTAKVEAAVRKVMLSPAVKKQLEGSTFVVLASDPKAFVDRARSDFKQAEALIAKGVLKPDE